MSLVWKQGHFTENQNPIARPSSSVMLPLQLFSNFNVDHIMHTEGDMLE